MDQHDAVEEGGSSVYPSVYPTFHLAVSDHGAPALLGVPWGIWKVL